MHQSGNSYLLKLSVLFCFVFSLSFSGCKTLKKSGLGKKDKSEDSARAVLANISARAFQPEWLNAKARITYEDADLSIGGSATIRLKKDSVLWMSIKKLGFEVVRAKVTPDSVYILDRINNEYAVFSLQYLEESYSLPGDFQLLQSIFLGSPYFYNPAGVALEQTPEAYKLTDQFQMHQITYQVDPSNYSLKRLDYQTIGGDRQLQVDLEDYNKIEGKQLFSYFRNLSMTSSETGNLGMTLKFSQIELDVPKSMSFQIPPRYSKMDE